MPDAKAASVQALRTILLFLPSLRPEEKAKLAARLVNPPTPRAGPKKPKPPAKKKKAT